MGIRIGQELAVKLQHIGDDKIFWANIKTEWEDLGMGHIEFDNLPPKMITVNDGNACDGRPQSGGMFCNMDESVIAGIVKERHGKSVNLNKRECSTSEEMSCCYEIAIND